MAIENLSTFSSIKRNDYLCLVSSKNEWLQTREQTNINKEFMAKIKGAVVVNTGRCKGCNLCVVACPSDVLELHPREVNDKGYHFVYMKNPDDCIGCASCGLVCPDGCLTIYKVKL